MITTLAALGGLTLIYLAFHFYTSYLNKKDWEDKERRQKEVDIHKFGPLEGREERKALIEEQEDKQRKKNILNRIYAYKYEEVVFDIFIDGGIISENDLISEVQNRLNLEIDEAIDLLREWHSHNLISSCYKTKIPACELGLILKYDANIISKADLTLEKWREKKGYILKDKSINLNSDAIEEIEIFYNRNLYNGSSSSGSLTTNLRIQSLKTNSWNFSNCKTLENYEIQSIKKAKVKLKDDEKILKIKYKDESFEFFPLIFNSELEVNDKVDPSTIMRHYPKKCVSSNRRVSP